MSTTPPDPTVRHELQLAGQTVTIQRPTGLKASQAFALMRALSRAMPDLQSDLARFRRDYERENVVELDRVQAKLRHPPRPLVLHEADEQGNVREVPALDEHGQPQTVPSPVDRLTEADWAAADNVYRIPQSPSVYEVAIALFDKGLEAAETHVYRLLALFTIDNAELKRARADGRVDELLEQRCDDLLADAFADELVELAVVVGEAIDHHLIRKSRDLGDRLGNVLRLVGVDLPPSPPPNPSASNGSPSSSRPSSSTATPASTPAGPPTPSSTPPMTSSSSSPISSTKTDEPNRPTTSPKTAPVT